MNNEQQPQDESANYSTSIPSSMAEQSISSVLLRNIRQDPNDALAWEAFFLQYRPRLIGYFRSFSLSVHDAEELTQDVFTRIHQNVDKFDSVQGSTRNWIFTIAYRMWVDVQRKWKKNKLVWQSIQNIDPQHFATEITEQYDEALVDEALENTHLKLLAKSKSKNGQRDFEIFIQNWRHEISREQIASDYKMSIHAIGMVILRVQRIFKEEVKKLFDER